MKRLIVTLGIALSLTSCHTLRGAGAGFGAVIGAHEAGLGGAAVGALAGYGAGALIEDHAYTHHSSGGYGHVHGGCRACAPPVWRRRVCR